MRGNLLVYREKTVTSLFLRTIDLEVNKRGRLDTGRTKRIL